jgi:hypothetical protein
MSLKLRKPTGLVPYPFVLLEGEEKAGKTYTAAMLAASPRVGEVYWMDIGEADVDRYGALADYHVVDHDGSFADIKNQLVELGKLPGSKGGKPNVIIVDSLSALWSLLVDRAQNTAEQSRRPSITMDLWNKAKREWRQCIEPLVRFDGIVIATARGKMVAEVENGKPTGEKSWSVESEKSLPYDVDAWIRFTRSHGPFLIGCRSLSVRMRPGVDKPQGLKEFKLDDFIFGTLGVGKQAGKRVLPESQPGVMDIVEAAEATDQAESNWAALNTQVHRALKSIGIEGDQAEAFRQYIAKATKSKSWAEVDEKHLASALTRITEQGEQWVRSVIKEKS